MTVAIGSKIPAGTFKQLTDEGIKDVTTAELFTGRTVILFSVPGAYTPTCSNEHLPGFVARADELKAKGVDEIVCIAVNDPFVMKAWGEDHGADGKVTLLSDWNGAFSAALGLTVDLGGAGLGVRGQRFAMRVKDGVVETLNVEPGKGVTVSGAEACSLALD